MSETEITKELIIATHPNEVHIALLEDKKLVEIHREKSSDQFSVGDIYLGKIRKIMPGLNAAFVNIGSDKDAFLHYLDLGNQALTINSFVQQAIERNKQSIANFKSEPEVAKAGKIGQILSSGQQVLVQIAKESISTKGPRVTTEISLAGRYLVLVPFMDKITVSQKIKSSEERKRLRKLVQEITPKRFGVIIRTVAEGKKLEDIKADMEYLVNQWKTLVQKLHSATAPLKIASDLDKSFAMIRDMLNDSFTAIHVDTQLLYKEIKDYLKLISFEKAQILHFYKDKQPIFEHFNVARQIKGSFGKVVTVKSGVYLIIEHTEAMHVIDVNSGNRMKSDKSQEENALEANLLAATEIVRQLRLRDMGGIITIDFIDLRKSENRTALFRRLTELMFKDTARHSILPMNKFGIIQLTRQRVRKETTIETAEVCPMCQGLGKVKPSILICEEMENMIDFLLTKQKETSISIAVHPFLYTYLTSGIFSIRLKWFFKFHKWIKLSKNQNHHLLQYNFLNRNNEEIVLWGEPQVNKM